MLANSNWTYGQLSIVSWRPSTYREPARLPAPQSPPRSGMKRRDGLALNGFRLSGNGKPFRRTLE